MVAWRLAESLVKLRSEVNMRWPNRSKSSDGSIGDAAHSSRSSDHNPWIADPPGPHVVSAIDITHDPKSGCDSYALAEMFRLSRDKRIKYVISNGKIFSGADGPSAWVWRKYNGSNKHDHHVHISVEDSKSKYDSKTPWGINEVPLPVHDEPHPEPPPPTLRRNSDGADVRRLQTILGIAVDGSFGPKTEAAVLRFQNMHGLHADGVVGPATWRALGEIVP
jgi:hypothetical protein